MKKKRTNNRIRQTSIRKKISQDQENDGFLPTRLQESVARSSPVSGWQRGDPFFDPWAPGGHFNKR